MLTKIILLQMTLVFTLSAKASLDSKIKSYIDNFQIKAVSKPEGLDEAKFLLGEKLFFDKIISGNKNISCSTCHDPNLGSSDSLPLSIGEGGEGIGLDRWTESSSHVVARNSPSLYNLGHKDMGFLFWDGRLSYKADSGVYITPSEVLNGDYPKRYDITEALGGALAAQALFPILSRVEMRGQLGSNDIADAKNDEKAWKIIMSRLFNTDDYPRLFKKAFPNVDEFNIGHFGNAVGHFQKHRFTAYNTPWDNYLRGDKRALSSKEKRGALVFFEQGKCIQCHNGTLLGGRSFRAIATPQIGPGKNFRHNDEGRFLVTKRDGDRYKFRVPPLRNVAISAPYFHSGIYKSLSNVIDHYRGGLRSIDRYDSRWLDDFVSSNYPSQLFVETNKYMIFKKKEAAHPIIFKGEIKISDVQKDDLLLFLELSLTNVGE